VDVIKKLLAIKKWIKFHIFYHVLKLIKLIPQVFNKFKAVLSWRTEFARTDNVSAHKYSSVSVFLFNSTFASGIMCDHGA
jgi:hypothetical protein